MISVESLPVLELSEMLWARKFDERVDDKILDALDVIRREGHQQGAHFERVRAKQLFDGHEVCLTIGRKQGDAVTMRPCSSNKAQALEVGTCSSDGSIILNSSSSYMQVSKGRFSIPFCPIRSVGAPNNCLDLEGESVNPGTLLIGWGCSKKWNQVKTSICYCPIHLFCTGIVLCVFFNWVYLFCFAYDRTAAIFFWQ